MKLIGTLLLACLLNVVYLPVALAYKLPDKALLQTAEVYAVTHRNLEWDAFMAPWTAYEESSPSLKPPAERAVVYTPFLLVAMEKKQALLQQQTLEEGQIAAVLQAYEGSLVFCLILRSNQPKFTEALTALVQQDGRLVKPHYVHVEAPQAIGEAGAPASFEARVYVYFPQGQINPERSAGLLAFEPGRNARHFLLPLAAIS